MSQDSVVIVAARRTPIGGFQGVLSPLSATDLCAAAIEAAVAEVERISADIDDSTLKAPRSGRVLYRLAEPGEVLAAGGKILTLLDLTDVGAAPLALGAPGGEVRAVVWSVLVPAAFLLLALTAWLRGRPQRPGRPRSEPAEPGA